MNITTKIIQNLGIDLNKNITHKVLKLFQQTRIEIDESMGFVYVMAGIGILSQIQQADEKEIQQTVNERMSLQKVMCSVNEQQKELYLDAISHIIRDQGNGTRWVSEKLQKVRKVHTLYKKYKHLCQIISMKTSYPQSFMDTLFSFIWSIYSNSKEEIKKSCDRIYNQQLLYQVIQVAFVEYSQIFSEKQIASINQGIIEIYDEQNYLPEIRKISETYLFKHFQNIPSFVELFSKQEQQLKSILDRLTSDMNNDYYKNLSSLDKKKRVDQVCFLSVSDGVSPESFSYLVGSKQNSSKQEQKTSYKNINNSFPTPSMQAKKDNFDNGNVLKKSQTSRLKTLSWVQNCIQKVNEQNMRLFEFTYNKYNKKMGYASFKTKILRFIQNSISKFSQKCRNKKKRKNNIFLFYVYFILQLLTMYDPKQIQLIFRDQKSLIAVLCLITELFNFCYHAHQGSYRQYVNIFELDEFYAFRPINWIGRFINLPDIVSDHLYEIERRFVVKQIWQDQTGYNIITNTRDSIPINQMAIFKRIEHHIYLRISEIVKQIKISNNIINKIYNMVFSIISNKPSLLKYNNIDQIIICSITACMSINELQQNITLEKVIQFYHTISQQYSEKERLFDGQGKQLQIIQFYNQIFLPQIDSIIKDNPTTANFLLTPNRITIQQKIQSGRNTTPLKMKFSEKPSKVQQITMIKAPTLPDLNYSYQNHKNSPINQHQHFHKLMKTYSLVSLAEEEDDDEQCGMELNKTMKKIEFQNSNDSGDE